MSAVVTLAPASPAVPVLCSYCDQPAERCTGADIYPSRPDLAHLRFWRCQPCGAHVGCHKDSDAIPLGTLANAVTRALRQRCHAAFDPIWKGRTLRRNEAYRRLADLLRIPVGQCHISQFGEKECAHALNKIQKLRREVGLS